MAGARIDTLEIADAPDRWRELGFQVEPDGTCRVGATTLRLGAGGSGIVSWTLRGARGVGSLDGLPTVRLVEPLTAAPRSAHPNTALSIDHVVVTTPDFERTLEAIDEAGMTLRRTREAPNGMLQAFFRHGEAILEVVGPREPRGEEPARFWGLVACVADIELAARLAGERLGTVRSAVQRGRRIATVSEAGGLTTKLALLSP